MLLSTPVILEGRAVLEAQLRVARTPERTRSASIARRKDTINRIAGHRAEERKDRDLEEEEGEEESLQLRRRQTKKRRRGWQLLNPMSTTSSWRWGC